ncbi:MAG TPA: hypothetical protein VIG33_16990 [Pseudobdellovibrionaceae bacterium]
MFNVVNISEFKPQSYSISLRQIHRKLDRTNLGPSLQIDAERNFIARIRGEFLSISRKKKNIPIEIVARYLRSDVEFIERMEAGIEPIYDYIFLRLSAYYGTLNDAFALTNKIEKVLNPP